MEKSLIEKKCLYKIENTALLLLSEIELKGDYPNWFYDIEVHRHNSHWAFPKCRTEVDAFISSLASDKSKIVFAIYDLDTAQHIGNISIQSIDLLHGHGELAFLLGEKKAWGKGHGFRAAQLCLKHCFHYLNLHRVYLGCLSTNIGMNKLASKLGFKQEGRRREAVNIRGAYVDINEYGLLTNEYEVHSNS